MDEQPMTILLIEDNDGDARLIREALADARDVPFVLERTERLATGLARLAEGGIDVALVDLSLPDSWGLDTFVSAHAQAPEVPIVVLTGLDDERLAIRAVQKGAQDYLVKGQVDSHLIVRSLRYAIERERLLRKLQEALARIKILSGLLPICASCKKIRDDKGYWNQIEDYIRDHSEADFSHSLCPMCTKELYASR